ncbi:MAG: TerC family protein [Odoribacteraceae bacterium]|jgi:tellurite resistance protein TerC|nr:TerC family protein [Odoribacteraceae bacterium]
MNGNSLSWVGFIVFVLVMLLLDLGVFHKKDEEMKVRTAFAWSVLWITLALLFNALVYFTMGSEQALDFFTAYLLEKSLSVDNLFVFIMIFGYFSVAPRHQHKILFWGIFGALLMRAVFIFAGVALITRFEWIMYVFGVFLVYTGLNMLWKKEGTNGLDPDKSPVIRFFKKLLPVAPDNPKAGFFTRVNGKVHATTFFIALLFIEVSDLIFAVDSIPAVLSVSSDSFIVFTSNIFAILGLRSLYFALNGIMRYFHYLSYALAGILSFIGLKMCVNELMHDTGHLFHISNLASLGVIIVLLSVAILASLWRKRGEANKTKLPEKA